MKYGFIGCGNMGGALIRAAAKNTKDIMIADFDNWEALAAYKADTMRDNVIEYVKTIAEVRAKVEYER